MKSHSYPNLLRSIRVGQWSTLEPVSRRIMQLWKARGTSQEKILLIFSSSGGGQYCGLAEMVGPWDPNQSIEAWESETGDSAGYICQCPCAIIISLTLSSIIPINWTYVKDVGFDKFIHIQQGRNTKGSVTNMWNGQHVQHNRETGEDVARTVIETYVTAPHITNVLVWQKGSAPRIYINRFGKSDHGATLSDKAAEPSKFQRLGPPPRGNQIGHGHHMNRGNYHGSGRGGRHVQPGRLGFGTSNATNTRDIHGPPLRRPHIAGQQWPRGRVLGEIQNAAVTPQALTQSTANLNPHVPPTQFDGAHDNQTAPLIIGAQHTFNLTPTGNGNFVATGAFIPPPPAHPATPHANFDHFQPPYGPRQHGSNNTPRNRRSNLGRTAGARNTSTQPIIINHHYYGTQSPATPINNGIQIINNLPSSTPSHSSLKHAASAAEFVPQTESNRHLRRASTQQNLHHATSFGSFASQGRTPYAPAQLMRPSAAIGATLHSPAFGPGSAVNINIDVAPHVDQNSQGSYPSYFRGADSMAGYDPRTQNPQYNMQSMPLGPFGFRVPLQQPWLSTVPQVDPGTQENRARAWAEQTSSEASIGGAPSVHFDTQDINELPYTERAAAYVAMGKQADVFRRLKQMGKTNDAAYLALLEEKADADRALLEIFGLANDGESIAVGSAIASNQSRAASTEGKAPKAAGRAPHERGGVWGSMETHVRQQTDELVRSPVASAVTASASDEDGGARLEG